MNNDKTTKRHLNSPKFKRTMNLHCDEKMDGDLGDNYYGEQKQIDLDNEDDLIIAKWVLVKTLDSAVNYCMENHHSTVTPHPCFIGPKIPDIMIHDYIDRLVTYMSRDSGTILQSAILIDRLCTKYNFPFTPETIHRTLFATILLAAKIRLENSLSMGYYAECGGVSIQECLKLEHEILKAISYDVTVIGVEGDIYVKKVEHLVTALQVDANEKSHSNPCLEPQTFPFY